MRQDLFTVATMTLARAPEEGPMLARALDALARSGLPVHLADGGSAPEFVAWLDEHPHLAVVPPATGDAASAPGLVRQVQRSVASGHATARPFILYTEPDKEVFFEAHLANFLGAATGLLEGPTPAVGQEPAARVGVVLASRSEAGLITFPQEQQATERVFNRLCSVLLGVEADYTYGPFVMRRELSEVVAEAPRELGWGWRPFVFAQCIRRGMAVVSLEGDHVCPVSQRHEADAAYRIAQLSQNVEGLRRGGAFDLRRHSP